jgi:hypothetical protein
MRLEINSGGLDSFFNGVCSFINAASNTYNSDKLIGSFQKVVNKTNNISGGVGTLSTAVGFVRARKTAEETRKTAVQGVKNKTDSFIQTAIRVDNAVATSVNKSKAEFYKTNPWLKPPSNLEKFLKGVGGGIKTFCGVVGYIGEQLGNWVADKLKQVWDGVVDVAKKCWDGVVKWYNDHPIISRIVIGVVAVAAGLALTILTGGAALPFLIGAAVLVGSGTAFGAVIGGITGGWEGALQGAADGFMFGGIAALSGAVIGLTSLTGGAATIASGTLAGGMGGGVTGGLSSGTFEGFASGLIIGAATGAVVSTISVGVSNFIKGKLVKTNNPSADMPYQKGRPSLNKDFKKVIPSSESYHAGHKFGHEYRWLKSDYLKGYIGAEQLRTTYNNPAHYTLEPALFNLSHAGEASKPLLELMFPSLTNGVNTLKFPIVTSIISNNFGFNISKRLLQN